MTQHHQSAGAPALVRIGRFTLEAVTPLSIGAGGTHSDYDAPVVRDACDLPAIPGTSLAGVLRHLYEAHWGTESTDELFGFQDQTRGAASSISVAWSLMQDSKGHCVDTP